MHHVTRVSCHSLDYKVHQNVNEPPTYPAASLDSCGESPRGRSCAFGAKRF